MIWVCWDCLAQKLRELQGQQEAARVALHEAEKQSVADRARVVEQAARQKELSASLRRQVEVCEAACASGAGPTQANGPPSGTPSLYLELDVPPVIYHMQLLM